MKAKLVRSVKKLAAVTTGALFLGATMGMASVFASGLGSLPGAFVSNGHVNSVFVVGQNAAPSDIIGAVDISAALTAAAAHTAGTSGQITIGALALSSKANSVNYFDTNASSLTQMSPVSINLVAQNFTSTWKSNAENYTSVENLTFLKQSTFNGLNVVFPAGSYELQSYIVNRSAASNKVELGKNIVGLNSTFATLSNVTYEIGNTAEAVTLLNKTEAQFGTVTTKTNVNIPSTFTVGSNTIDMVGAVTDVVTPSDSQIEVSVNGGAVTYLNLSKTTTVGPVTITTPATIYQYSNGTDFVKTLKIASVTYTQNLTSSHAAVFPGLSTLNVTNDTKNFYLTSTAGFTLKHSFSTSASYTLPQNLTTIDLEALTSTFKGTSAGDNVSLSVGAAKFDNITVKPTGNVTTLDVVSAVPNIGVGAGALFSSAVNVPSEIAFASTWAAGDTYVKLTNILANNSLLYNVNGIKGSVAPGASGVTANSTVAFSSLSTSPAGVLDLAVTNASKEKSYAAFTPTLNFTTGAEGGALVFYTLPNGQYLGLHYLTANNGVTGANKVLGQNLTYILNFTASTTASPTNTSVTYSNTKHLFWKNYGGYNVTVNEFNISGATTPKLIGNLSIKAPVATVGTYSIVPGFSGFYNAGVHSTSFNATDTLNAGTVLGTFTFNGTVVKFTDLLGETLTANVKSYSNATTYFGSAANTSKNTFGDYIQFTGKPLNAAKFYIPTQNYTLAVAGTQVVSGKTNYSIGQTVTGGKLISISGVSGGTAASYINSNPDLAMTDNNFAGATNSVPVIIVGGPAINTLAAEALTGSATPIYGSAFTNLTGVASGEALIEYFSSVASFNSQPAILVAGYSASGTTQASEILALSLVGEPLSSAVLNGTKVILSTSTPSYTGVTIVNKS